MLKHAQWQLSQTTVKAPVDGWVTNLSTRVGDYATTGHPVFALVDSHSFYVLGYFEETKLRHIRIGDPAQIILYSNQQTLHGHVASIGRAIVDQSVEQGTGLVANIKPNIPGYASRSAFRCGLPLMSYRRTSLWSPAPPALSRSAGSNESAGPVVVHTARVKATRPQWRYALRNGIAMCLALSIAYALDLDEPYWAMTSAAVVSFPTVGGVISKSFGRIAGSLLGACAALLLAGHTLNDHGCFCSVFPAGWRCALGLRAVHQQRGLRLSACRLYLRHHRVSGD